MYKMEINVSGQQRIFLFRGPGCRKAMFEWWHDHVRRAEAGEDISSIRVWGTVGNKTDVVLEWARARATRRGTAARRLSTPVTPTPMAELPTRWPTTTQGTTAR